MSSWVVYRITFSLVKFFLVIFIKTIIMPNMVTLPELCRGRNFVSIEIQFISFPAQIFFCCCCCSWFLHCARENLPKNNTNFDLKLTLGSSSKSNCIADTFFSVATLVLSAFHSDQNILCVGWLNRGSIFIVFLVQCS